ncbi:hypothetical protein [Dyella acidiphila]|uniref:Sel1 repeat family protein n=1 Tax=Dyella acidiphila TaxID=2775866 RepID=A0ABR9GEA5_9GAMM|nr:hypothetical protein [Dyella acidiphila]MBE1162351.1 hypothetical protein [Dyella acidiphila]
MITSFILSFAFLFFDAGQMNTVPGTSAAPVEMRSSVDDLSKAAALGDALAAAKLSDYFRYERNMDPKWKYWALVAAENGDVASQFDEYNILSDSSDPLVKRRAFYWLKKSAQGGFPYSKIEFQNCFPSGKFESLKQGCLGSGAHH